MSGHNYSWNENNNQANIEKHGISFQTASLILNRGNPVHSDYERNEEQRTISIGRLNGETIGVVHSKDGEILSAHKSRKFEQTYDAALANSGKQATIGHDEEFSAWRQLDREQRTRNADAYQDRKQRDEKEVAAAQNATSQELEKIKARQSVEATAERAPRLEHDQQERAALEQKLSQKKAIDMSQKNTPARKSLSADFQRGDDQPDQSKTRDPQTGQDKGRKSLSNDFNRSNLGDDRSDR